MLYVACPSCGERGKIPPTLVGSRIKCKKCGISFNVAPAAAKVPVAEGTARDLLTLPLFPAMQDEDVPRVCRELRTVLR